MAVKLLTEHHLEFLSLKEGCTGSSESTLAKMQHCWKSHVKGHIKLTERVKGRKMKIQISNQSNKHATPNEPRHVISNNVAF